MNGGNNLKRYVALNLVPSQDMSVKIILPGRLLPANRDSANEFISPILKTFYRNSAKINPHDRIVIIEKSRQK